MYLSMFVGGVLFFKCRAGQVWLLLWFVTCKTALAVPQLSTALCVGCWPSAWPISCHLPTARNVPCSLGMVLRFPGLKKKKSGKLQTPMSTLGQHQLLVLVRAPR